MAKKTKQLLVDELDGSPAQETIKFGLDSRFYEIDLNEGHAEEMRGFLKPYVRKGRATEKPQENIRQIRQWAQDNGYEVSTRGRLADYIIDAYRNAKKPRDEA